MWTKMGAKIYKEVQPHMVQQQQKMGGENIAAKIAER